MTELIIILVIGFLCLVGGYGLGEASMRDEAVREGKALYCQNTDEKNSDSNKVFTWGNKCSVKEVEK